MELRGILKIEAKNDFKGFLFPQPDEGEDGVYRLNIYQTGRPQSAEEMFIGTLFLFVDGTTKFIEHRSGD